MRRTVAILGALVLGVVALPPTATAAPRPDGLSAADRAALAAGLPLATKAAPGKAPAGPNPFLSLLPDASKADYTGWKNWLDTKSQEKSQQRSGFTALAAPPFVADEAEPAGTWGANDTLATAQRITQFGSSNPKVRILGGLSPQVATPVTVPANAEDDGSIPLAADTGIGANRAGITTTAQIGDGPFGGTGTGDFDFYKLQVAAGQLVTVDIDTPTSTLDSIVILYDATGKVVASNDDSAGQVDSLLSVVVPTAGTYYAMVAGYGNVPANPQESGSGDGSGSQGAYTVTMSATADDKDFFAVKLRKGDILGASVKGAANRVTVFDTVPREVHGSDQDASSLYPEQSPLPAGGNAVTDYVAQANGWHYLQPSAGVGAYDLTVEIYRAPLEGQKPVQTLFLDFDGARVNTSIFKLSGPSGNRDLSPFSAFTAKWGLTREEEDELITLIHDQVEDNLITDLEASGLNSRFRLKLTNSRENPDTFGKANVSRIVVGGTTQESGIDTLGIAQSIDPGNFGTSETALVLLDLMSEPAGPAYSLNSYITPASDKVAFLGKALGNVIAHEAGHFFGNWHTDNANENVNLMDAGGDAHALSNMFGVGPDGIGGTADDLDVDFGDDVFKVSEGFTGTENTMARIEFGLTS
jgi:hypothetical protein